MTESLAKQQARQAVSAAIWAVTGILFGITFYIALAVDLIQRWGQPLILELSTASVVWIVAYLAAKVALAIAKEFSGRSL